MTLTLPIDAEANELLSRSPLALLIGMVLDQQVTMEKAFQSPYDLARRLGHEPTAAELAGYDLDALIAIFAERPVLHRFPKVFAARVQGVCQALVEQYDGDAEKLWSGAGTGKELFDRISALPGFGKQKSQIFIALLGKRFGVRPPGWREAAGDYGPDDAYKSVADIVDDESLAKVREYKRALRAAAKAADD